MVIRHSEARHFGGRRWISKFGAHVEVKLPAFPKGGFLIGPRKTECAIFLTLLTLGFMPRNTVRQIDRANGGQKIDSGSCRGEVSLPNNLRIGGHVRNFVADIILDTTLGSA
jgi:hypothetical protein